MKLKVFYKGYFRQIKGCFIEILFKNKEQINIKFSSILNHIFSINRIFCNLEGGYGGPPRKILKTKKAGEYVLKRVSFGSKDCTKELKLECAYFLGQTS